MVRAPRDAFTMLLMASGSILLLSGCSTRNPAPSADETGKTTVTVPKPEAGDADAQHSALLAAAEPFENLTEQAPTATRTKLAGMIDAAKKAADGVSSALDGSQKAALEGHLSNIGKAQAKGDRTTIALAAVEGYRTLVEGASDTGKVPRAVSLLDYSGFRYQADLSASPVRWSDAASAVTFAHEQWGSIADRVTDASLKRDFAKAVTDMDAAANNRDAKVAKAASTRELDLVDKLESFFSHQ